MVVRKGLMRYFNLGTSRVKGGMHRYMVLVTEAHSIVHGLKDISLTEL